MTPRRFSLALALAFLMAAIACVASCYRGQDEIVPMTYCPPQAPSPSPAPAPAPAPAPSFVNEPPPPADEGTVDDDASAPEVRD